MAHFFEERFQSIAILDEEALLSVSVYVDLNPVAAGVAAAPETSEHTSIKQRVDHALAQGRTQDLAAAQQGSVAGSRAASGLEESLWLCPIEDRRGLDSAREGMIAGFSLGSYLLLVDYTGRLFRDRKAVISAELAGVFERLGCSASRWTARLEKLRHASLARPVLRGHQGQASRDCGKAQSATPGESRRLLSPMSIAPA